MLRDEQADAPEQTGYPAGANQLVQVLRFSVKRSPFRLTVD